MKEINLTIRDLAAQGDGIADYDGKTCFVAGALAGEEVRAKITLDDKKEVRAVCLEALKPSAFRVSPPCPHFLRCGGCKLQHFATPAMTRWKEDNLKKLLAREGVDVGNFLPSFVTAAETRRRARLNARHAKAGVILGFNAERSNEIVDLAACPVLVPAITALLPALRNELASWLPKNESCDLQITALPEGIDLVVIGGRALDLESREILGSLAEKLNIAQLSWRKWDRSPTEPLAHRMPLSVRFGDISVPFPAGSFLQASASGEENLIAFAKNAAQGANKILDLFCGLGGFGLSMISAKTRHFADLDGPAVTSLERAVRGDAHKKVMQRNLIREPFTPYELNAFDAVIFDPPRGGAKAQVSQLALSSVKKIVAISCDPPSFARDAKLIASGGYKLESLQMTDQFLWSPHCELAASFSRD